ncbi:MAG: hypothetical protein VW625_04810, partial [Perlucidibaca sp.]
MVKTTSVAADKMLSSHGEIRKMQKWLWVALVGGVLTGCDHAESPASGTTAPGVASVATRAQCLLKNPVLGLGSEPDMRVNGMTYTLSHEPDAPGEPELAPQHVGRVSGACAAAKSYRFGSGLYDTTGPIGG